MTTESEALRRLQADGGNPPSAGAIAYGEGRDQVFETSGPAAARTLVVVHGGYFRPAVDRTHARPMARALAEQGWQVVLAEYRRVPGSPVATTDDLTALDTHLRDHGHDVAAWVGHSAGGALVLWRALTPDLPPVRVVALAPVADFDRAMTERLGGDAVRDWLGAAPGALTRWDPTRLLAAHPAAAERIHLVHGAQDETVPVTQGEGLPVDRTVVAGAHHFDLIDPASPHWPTVTAALSRR